MANRVRDLSFFFQLADHRNPESLAARLRARRLDFFRSLLDPLPPPVRILDLGGTSDFWKRLTFSKDGMRVTIVNVDPGPSDDPRIETLVGDARDLRQFGDSSFDVVYSNSVIEHVGTFEDQRRMASEVRRLAKRYFVQTPNAYFPVEPHFLFPGFQFLPLEARAYLLTKARLGWVPREPDRERAREVVGAIRLLTVREMQTLFPEATVHRESIFGLTKSITSYHGW